MGFDAGAIEARLTVDTGQFDRDMSAAEARVKAFTDNKHEVKVSAVFDNASLSKATKAFADLDNQISRQAAQRLRSSPQGSVLGALNALFSPHPVTGAPSASQSAQGGLLGKIVQAPATNTGGGNSGASTVGQVLGTNGGTANTTDRVNVVGTPTNNSIKTTDRVSVLGLPTSGGTIVTKDKIEADASDLKATATKAGKDAADATSDSMAKESKSRGSGWFSGFLSGIPAMIGGLFGGAAGAEGGKGEESFLDKGLVGGVGPGILGTSFKTASISGLLGAGLGAVPALGAVGAGLGVVGGGAALLISQNAQVKTAAEGLVTTVKSVFTQAAGPLIKPLEQAFTSLGSFLKSVGPEFKQVFGAAAPLIKPITDGLEGLVKGLLPGLVSILKAAAPAFAVFSQFLAGIGSGLGQMFKAFSTVIGPSSVLLKALFDVILSILPTLASLGTIMATTLGPAFKAFAGAVQALMPFLAGIAKIFAQFAGAVLEDLSGGLQLVANILKAIAPAFDVLATSLGSVFNTLESKGGFAQLGDVLEALAEPIGKLITSLVSGLAPAIPPILELFSALVNILSTVAVQVLQALIPPLTQLVTTALGALVQILPTLVPLVTKFLGAFTQDAADIIVAIAVPLAKLAEDVLVKLLIAAAPLVPVIVDLLNAFTPLINVLTPVFVRIISDLAQALTAVISAIPPGLLQTIAITIVAIVGAVKLWAAAMAILDIALDANPIGLITLAIAALVVGLVELADHWSTVWGAIETVGKAAYNWLMNDFVDPIINWFTKSIPNAWSDTITFLKNNLINPIISGLTTALNWVDAHFVNPIVDFFTQTIPRGFDAAITAVKSRFITPFQNGLLSAYQWVVKNVADPIQQLFTKTIPGWFGTAVSAISSLWGKVEGVVETPVKFVVNNVLDKLINLFDDVTNAVGLGKPIPTISLASGGLLPGYGGGDILPALLEPGEVVVDKQKARMFAPLFKAMGVPGFATGGIPGGGVLSDIGNFAGDVVGDIAGGVEGLAKATLAIATGNPTALANAILGMFGASSSGGLGGTVGKALLGMPAALIGDFSKWIMGTNNSASAQAGATGATLKPSGSGATVQALMQSMAASVGWTGAEWIALDEVENREAGFNINATNPSSGAYGLAQFINGASEYAQYGGNSTTAAGQITGMLNYIKDRYGDPEAAWQHELAYGWYDQGGYLKPGYTLAYNGTGHPEPVISGGGDFGDKLDRMVALLAEVRDTTAAVPAGVGRHVGGAINGAASAASFRNRFPRGGS